MVGINATHYPILAFMLGTILTRVVQHHFKEADSINKRQRLILGVEIAVLTVIAGISPYIPDLLASASVSMIAAAQLQEFRELNGGPFTFIDDDRERPDTRRKFIRWHFSKRMHKLLIKLGKL